MHAPKPEHCHVLLPQHKIVGSPSSMCQGGMTGSQQLRCRSILDFGKAAKGLACFRWQYLQKVMSSTKKGCMIFWWKVCFLLYTHQKGTYPQNYATRQGPWYAIISCATKSTMLTYAIFVSHLVLEWSGGKSKVFYFHRLCACVWPTAATQNALFSHGTRGKHHPRPCSWFMWGRLCSDLGPKSYTLFNRV